jgi:hypothetical protein
MAAAVEDDDFVEIERRHAFETGDVDAELVRVRAALVMRVDAADGTEMMLGAHRVEPIGRELVLALRNAEGLGRGGNRHGPAHPTDRTGASPRGSEAFGERDREPDCAAVAGAVEGNWVGRSRIDHRAPFSHAGLDAAPSFLLSQT